MPRPKSPPKPLALLDPPSQQLEQVTALNELVAQRRQELSDTTHKLTLLHAQIQSERQKWDRERKTQQQTLDVQMKLQEESIQVQREDVERLHRAAQELYDRMALQNEDSRLRMFSLNEREQLVSNLNQERLETAKLRRQAEQQMDDANQRLQTVQNLQNDVNAKAQESQQLLVECEQRNKLMNDEWNKLTAWREELTLQSKDVEIVQREIDKKLAQLSVGTQHKPQEDVIHAEG